VILILGATITFVIILIAILFCYYTKRIKYRINKEIAIQKKPEEYEEIEIYGLGDEKTYNAYDEINENEVQEEVRYTDPSYSVGQDYVQLPPHIQIQTYDDCLSPSNDYNSYDDVMNEPKPMPRMSLKDKKLNLYQI
jgi:hypothetical protein